MPKKTSNSPESQAIVDSTLLNRAKLAIEGEAAPASVQCSVCGGEAAPTSTEHLCWVCRRLKISAWRDSDQQMTMQE